MKHPFCITPDWLTGGEKMLILDIAMLGVLWETLAVSRVTFGTEGKILEGHVGAGLTALFPLAVLFAMKEGNEKVPTLLTDYILKGTC